MQREDLKKYGFEWAGNLEISVDLMFGRLESYDEQIKKAEQALKDARASMRAEKKRIEKRISQLWSAEEIAAAKAVR